MKSEARWKLLWSKKAFTSIKIWWRFLKCLKIIKFLLSMPSMTLLSLISFWFDTINSSFELFYDTEWILIPSNFLFSRDFRAVVGDILRGGAQAAAKHVDASGKLLIILLKLSWFTMMKGEIVFVQDCENKVKMMHSDSGSWNYYEVKKQTEILKKNKEKFEEARGELKNKRKFPCFSYLWVSTTILK